MSDKFADIIVKTQSVYGMTGRYPVKYEWKGKKHWRIKISIRLLEEFGVAPNHVINVGKKIRIGPYPLLIIEELPWESALVCVRRDITFGLYALFHYFWQKFQCLIYWVWWRIIATCKVWGIIKNEYPWEM